MSTNALRIRLFGQRFVTIVSFDWVRFVSTKGELVVGELSVWWQVPLILDKMNHEACTVVLKSSTLRFTISCKKFVSSRSQVHTIHYFISVHLNYWTHHFGNRNQGGPGGGGERWATHFWDTRSSSAHSATSPWLWKEKGMWRRGDAATLTLPTWTDSTLIHRDLKNRNWPHWPCASEMIWTYELHARINTEISFFTAPWGPFSSAEGLLGVVPGCCWKKCFSIVFLENPWEMRSGIWKNDCLVWLISFGRFMCMWVNLTHGEAWGIERVIHIAAHIIANQKLLVRGKPFAGSGAAMRRSFELPSWSAQCPTEPASPSRRTALVVGRAERHAETGSFWESADPNGKTSNIFVDIACC